MLTGNEKKNSRQSEARSDIYLLALLRVYKIVAIILITPNQNQPLDITTLKAILKVRDCQS